MENETSKEAEFSKESVGGDKVSTIHIPRDKYDKLVERMDRLEREVAELRPVDQGSRDDKSAIDGGGLAECVKSQQERIDRLEAEIHELKENPMGGNSNHTKAVRSEESLDEVFEDDIKGSNEEESLDEGFCQPFKADGPEDGSVDIESSTDSSRTLKLPSKRFTFRTIRSHLNEDGNMEPLSPDTYSFIVCSHVCSKPFWFGMIISFLQFTMCGLSIWHFATIENEIIMKNISRDGMILQYLATTVAILVQSDFRIGLMGIQTGFDGSLSEKFLHASPWKWYLMSLLRMAIGLMGNIASFLVIVNSEDALQILMNFAGLQVLLLLDDDAYKLCKSGIFGVDNAAKIQEIEKNPYPKKEKCSLARLVMLLLLLVSFSVLGWTNYEQINDLFLLSEIQVDFADNALPDIGGYSGVYKIDKTKKKLNNRVQYIEAGPYFNKNDKDLKVIAYCADGYWALLRESKSDPCSEYIARSGIVGGYQFQRAQNTLWSTTSNLLPIDYVVIQRYEGPLEYNDTSLCPHLGVSDLLFFEKTDSISFEFRMLRRRDSGGQQKEIIRAYDRPIYIDEKYFVDKSTSNDYYVIIFSGRRWVATSTKSIPPIQESKVSNNTNMTTAKECIENYFSNGFYVDDLEKDSITAISSDTLDLDAPSNLQWYKAHYPTFEKRINLLPKPGARIEDAVLCATCDNMNQCRNNGWCGDDDSVCHCVHDATGILCQNPFVIDECFLDQIQTEPHLNVSFDVDNYYGQALKDLSTDTDIRCDYKNWIRRYVMSLVTNALELPDGFKENEDMCDLFSYFCNDESNVEKIQSSGTGGIIPTEIGMLTTLKEIDFRGGTTKGEIPTEISALTDLERVYVTSQEIGGRIPSEVGELTKISILHLEGHLLTGQIPSEVGQMTSLEKLHLGFNRLGGPIPSELGLITGLKRLILVQNEFTGQIPSELGRLTKLQRLLLSNNNLSGTVPPEVQRLKTEYDLVIFECVGNGVNVTCE